MVSGKDYLIGGILMLTAAGPALAADAIAKPWKGEAELGIVRTDGNTETQSIVARASVTNERDKWRHLGQIEALNTSSSEVTTAERYTVAAKSDYKLDDVSYVFGRLGYENDRFAGFNYRTTEVIGYGRRVINTDKVTLDLEGGPGARQTEFRNGDTENEMIARLAALFAWKVSNSATFSEDLSTEIGEESTITKSVTALKAQVADNLAMKATLTLRHVSDVPAGTEETDTETALTLVYGF